jgi:antitoxin component YwqK of YwqJK toxin-antitoxin module
MMGVINKDYLIFLTVLIAVITGCASDEEDSRKYYPDGNIKSVVSYQVDSADSLYKEYFENGNVKSVTYWKDGLQTGVAKFYYKSGKLKSKSYWKEGKAHGKYENYYEDGTLEEVGYSKKGLDDGEYSIFYPSGQLLQSGSYKEGIRHGLQMNYNKDGTPMGSKRFYNVQGQEYQVEIITYNADSTIKEQSSRIVIAAEKDTVELGEPLQLKLIFEKPRMDSTYFLISADGGYDEKFYIVDKDKIDTLGSNRPEVIYKVIPKATGLQHIRGLASNLKITYNKNDSVISEEIHKYFEYPFFVKE